MTLKENVKQRRLAKGLTQDQLAALAKVSQQVIADIESGRTREPRRLHAIAAALDATVHELDPTVPAQPILGNTGRSGPMVAIGERNLPVYAAAEGGNGAMIVSWEPIEFTSRPAPLLNIRDGYGIYIVGDSMFPAYEPGDIALVNPHVQPRPHQDAIFFKSKQHDGSEALVKRLLKMTLAEWKVQQWNPQKELILPRSEWKEAHLVVGRYVR